MSLKIKSYKKILSRTFWTIFLAAIIFFFGKVMIFETHYYADKEGEERVVVEDEEEPEVLDETEPTKEEIENYIVAPDRPRYLSIADLDIKNAKIVEVGTTSGGALGTPKNIFDVGWYNKSHVPGQGGVIVIDGHSGGGGKVGVFDNLPKLKIGAIIEIERGDGAVFKYKVVENTKIPLEESDEYMKTAFKSPEPDKESLTLITCSGDWSAVQKTYLSRQFIRAVITK